MHKANAIFSILITLSLFTAVGGLAENDHNEFGFYSDQEMSNTHVIAVAGTPFTVHMIITNPFNEDLNQPVESTSAIEFSYSFPNDSAFLISTIWDNGTAIDFSPEPNSHLVGWGEPLLNVDNAIYVGNKTFLLLTTTPFGIYLGPINPPSIPDHMAFLDGGSIILPLFPTSGSHENPVFGVNTEVVATEQTTFDHLKTLYR